MSHKNLTLALLPLLCLGALGAVTVIEEGRYILETTVEGDNLRVKAVVEGLGYVGFGVSPGGTMVGADIVIVGVNATGSAYIGDYYGTGNTRPTRDESQDVELVSATENATHTTVEFLRPLTSTDEFQDVPVAAGPQLIIWAIGSSDTPTLYHNGNRGSVEVDLLKKE